MKKYIKDDTFNGKFSGGDLIREVDTDKVFIFDDKEHRGCNFNSTFERVIEIKPDAKKSQWKSEEEFGEWKSEEEFGEWKSEENC